MSKFLSLSSCLCGLFFLTLLSSCEGNLPIPGKPDVIIEGRITTDGTRPAPQMQVKLVRSKPASPDIDELTARTDANGYYRFKFKANHELNERNYGIGYDISISENDPYFCSSGYAQIGHLPSADTTLVYNFTLPRRTGIKCVYKDPAKATLYELNTIFRFTCGVESDANQFLNETGAVSMTYTENPLYIPADIPVVVVTRGIDRQQSKALEKQDTIRVPYGASYTHVIDF